MTRFVILAEPRSGSNLLCTLLNSHPEILCHHEIFNPAGIFYAVTHRGGAFSLGTVEQRDRDPLAFLRRVWEAGGGHAAVGFKMTRGQEGVAFDAVCADAAVRKIVLRRRNVVRTYVSERIAQQTGRWEAYSDGERTLSGVRVRIDVDDLRAHVERNAAFHASLERALASTGQWVVRVAYEELFDRGRQRALLGALGVSAEVTLSAASVKQNGRDLRRLIENYDELAAALKGTDLGAALLDRTS